MSILEHHFPPLIAEKYGVNAAIFLRDIYHWCSTNRDNEQHFHEGRWWTYQTIKGLCRRHTYWTKNQVEHIIKTCKEKGALLSSHFNEDQFDRTSWYSLTDEAWALFEGPSSISEFSEMDFGKEAVQNRKNQKCNKDKYKTKNKTIPPIVPHEILRLCESYAGGDDQLLDAILGLLENRAAANKSPVKTARAMNGILNKLDKLSGGDRGMKLALLEKATVANWLTVFPLKPDELPSRSGAYNEEGEDGI